MNDAARRPLVAANWKLHGSLRFADEWARTLIPRLPGPVEVLVCPAFVHLARLAELFADSGVALGAQNLSEHRDGAFTGEVSAPMLKELGCRYVLVGHSERRLIYRESDAQIAEKLRAAAAAGLTPILCVGETLEQRRADAASGVLERQLAAAEPVLSGLAADAFAIAYEPVWAIGTGETATPEQAQRAHAFIRGWLDRLPGSRAADVRVVYGGSIKTDNAASLFEMNDVDGGLIGGASLEAAAFADICRAAAAPQVRA